MGWLVCPVFHHTAYYNYDLKDFAEKLQLDRDGNYVESVLKSEKKKKKIK